MTMLASNLMSVFHHAVMRQSVHHTISTLHHKVLAAGAFCDNSSSKSKTQTFRLLWHASEGLGLRGFGLMPVSLWHSRIQLNNPNEQSRFMSRVGV